MLVRSRLLESWHVILASGSTAWNRLRGAKCGTLAVIFAESIQLNGGLIALVLAILFLLFAVACFLLVAGSIWAVHAGRGDQKARTRFIGVLSVEAAVGVLVWRVFGLLAGVLLVMAFQGVLYETNRRR